MFFLYIKYNVLDSFLIKRLKEDEKVGQFPKLHGGCERNIQNFAKYSKCMGVEKVIFKILQYIATNFFPSKIMRAYCMA
jgi:hypothetical protein